jgi:hypothetical protein
MTTRSSTPLTKYDLLPLLPHLGNDRLSRVDGSDETDLDVLEGAVLAENVLARDAEEAQSVQDGLVKAADLGKVGVDL